MVFFNNNNNNNNKLKSKYTNAANVEYETLRHTCIQWGHWNCN